MQHVEGQVASLAQRLPLETAVVQTAGVDPERLTVARVVSPALVTVASTYPKLQPQPALLRQHLPQGYRATRAVEDLPVIPARDQYSATAVL